MNRTLLEFIQKHGMIDTTKLLYSDSYKEIFERFGLRPIKQQDRDEVVE